VGVEPGVRALMMAPSLVQVRNHDELRAFIVRQEVRDDMDRFRLTGRNARYAMDRCCDDLADLTVVATDVSHRFQTSCLELAVDFPLRRTIWNRYGWYVAGKSRGEIM
jgi:hypothetical protein